MRGRQRITHEKFINYSMLLTRPQHLASRSPLGGAKATDRSGAMGRMTAALFALLFAVMSAFATDLDGRLWLAASEGDLEGVKAALQDGADADYATPGEMRMSVL